MQKFFVKKDGKFLKTVLEFDAKPYPPAGKQAKVKLKVKQIEGDFENENR